MKKATWQSILKFVVAAGFTTVVATPKTLFASKDTRYAGRSCTITPTKVILGSGLIGDSPTDRTFVCPWDDTSDFRASSITFLSIELDAGNQGQAKACIDYWNVNGGACGPAMGNYKTLQPLLNTWVASNVSHFKYLAGTVVIPGYATGQAIKGIFAYIP